MSKEKLKICIPYRGRPNNLGRLLDILPKYLDNKYDHDIIVVEQNNNKLFNVGYLLNIGFDIFRLKDQSLDWTYIFHPVDCYPIDVNYSLGGMDIVCLYNTKGHELPNGQYVPPSQYAKSFCFKPSSFVQMNGYSLCYWGWGGEDYEPYRKAEKMGLLLEKRMVQFDASEDLTGHDDTTNIPNTNRCYSLTHQDWMKSGLAQIKYSIDTTAQNHFYVTF